MINYNSTLNGGEEKMYSSKPWNLGDDFSNLEEERDSKSEITKKVQNFLKQHKMQRYSTKDLSIALNIDIDKIRKSIRYLYELGEIKIVRVENCGPYAICGLYQDIEGPLQPLPFAADTPELAPLYNYYKSELKLPDEDIMELDSIARNRGIRKFLVKKEGRMNLSYKYEIATLNKLYQEYIEEEDDIFSDVVTDDYEERRAKILPFKDIYQDEKVKEDLNWDPTTGVIFDTPLIEPASKGTVSPNYKPTYVLQHELESITKDDEIREVEKDIVMTANQVAQKLGSTYYKARKILKELVQSGDVELTKVIINNYPYDGYRMSSENFQQIQDILADTSIKEVKSDPEIKPKEKSKTFKLFGFEISLKRSS